VSLSEIEANSDPEVVSKKVRRSLYKEMINSPGPKIFSDVIVVIN
jgi:hypothetical protein